MKRDKATPPRPVASTPYFYAMLLAFYRALLRIVVVLALLSCVGRVAVAQHSSDSSQSALRTLGASVLPNLDTIAGSRRAQTSQTALDFERVLSIYRWGASVSYSNGLPPHFGAQVAGPMIDILAEGRSRLQQQNSSLTTEASALLSGDVPIDHENTFGAFVNFFGTSYAVTASNQRAAQSLGLITNLLDGYAIGGLRYSAAHGLLLAHLSSGIARQSISPDFPFGAIIRSDVTAPGLTFGEGQILDGSMLLDERFFPQQVERYSNDRLRASLLSAIADNGANHLSASASLQRRDFYYTIDSATPTIRQQRREIAALLSDSLQYPIVPRVLDAEFDLQYEPRVITRTIDANVASSVIADGASLSTLLAPNNVTGLRLAAAGRVALYGSDHETPSNGTSTIDHPFSMNAFLRFEETDENVALRSSDLPSLDPTTKRTLADALDLASFSSKVTQGLVAATYQLSERTSLSAELGARLLRYDTPNPNNHDDRDELLTNARIYGTHRFTESLAETVELRGSRSHLDYLSSDRSAQNNVTQTIALSTTTSFERHRFVERFRGEVFANYTVLDYADQLPFLANSSYLLRGIDLVDSTIIPFGMFSEGTYHGLSLSGELNILERGSYNSAGFSEQRSATNLELSAACMYLISAAYADGAPFDVSIGGRAFLLVRTGVNEAVLTTQDYTELERQLRIGPAMTLTLVRFGGGGPQLYGDIWYGFLRSSVGVGATPTYGHQVESRLSVQWRF